MARRKPNGAATLAEVRDALAETEAQIGLLSMSRDAKLLAGDDGAVDELDGALARLRVASGRHSERIRLLEAQAQREEAEAVVKRRAGLIARVEAKLAERDATGAELQKVLAEADKLFRKMLAAGQAIDAAWSWPPSDRAPCLLPAGAVVTAVQHELFRVGSRPQLLGGQDKPGSDACVNFPGQKSPRLEWLGTPERVPQLSAVCREATQYASKLMRSGKTGIPVGAAAASPAPAAPSAASPTNGDAASPSDVQPDVPLDGRPRTPAEEKLAGLLSRQAKLAEDISPAGDVAYQVNLALIVEAQSAVDAEKQMEQISG